MWRKKKFWQNDLKCEWLGILRNDNYYLKKKMIMQLEDGEKYGLNEVWRIWVKKIWIWRKFYYKCDEWNMNIYNWIYVTEFEYSDMKKMTEKMVLIRKIWMNCEIKMSKNVYLRDVLLKCSYLKCSYWKKCLSKRY